MRATDRRAPDHRIILGEHVLDRIVDVGKGNPEGGKELLDARAPWWNTLGMLEIVRDDQLVDQGRGALVPDALDGAPHQRLVQPRSHSAPPRPTGWHMILADR